MKRSRKGFTLAELLVVIAIIAILVAIAIPVFSNATNKAKEAADLANVRAWYAEETVKLLTGETTAFPTTYSGTALNFSDKLVISDTAKTITYTPTTSGLPTLTLDIPAAQ